MIWLTDKSVDDIVKIPIDLHAGRLDVKPSDLNHVYEIDTLLFFITNLFLKRRT